MAKPDTAAPEAPAAAGDDDAPASTPATDAAAPARRATRALLRPVVVLPLVAVLIAAAVAGGLTLWLRSRTSAPPAAAAGQASATCPTSGADHPIGNVRGVPLLSSVFDARLCASLTGALQGGAPDPSSSAYPAFLQSLKDRVLKSYVFDVITAQEARIHNVEATQQQVDAEVQTDIQTAGGSDQLNSQLAAAGASLASLQDETRSRLNEINLVDELAKGRAADVVSRLQAGLPFDQAAKQFSDDPATRDAGGALGKVTLDQLNAGDPVLKQAILQMRPGDLTTVPVRDAAGYVIVFLQAADATTRTVHVIRINAPTPYSTRERPAWFSEFIFLDIQGDCQQNALSITASGLSSPCSAAPTPSPSPSP
jgi:hypothetical protein